MKLLTTLLGVVVCLCGIMRAASAADGDLAYYADTYRYYTRTGASTLVETRQTSTPVLIVKFGLCLPESCIAEGRALSLLNSAGDQVATLTLLVGLGTAANLSATPKIIGYNGAVFLVTKITGPLDQVTIHYAACKPYKLINPGEPESKYEPAAGASDSTIAVAKLPEGMVLDDDGTIKKQSDNIKSLYASTGSSALLDNLLRDSRIAITPETSNDANGEYGADYHLASTMKRYPLDEKTRVIFDMRIDGRITSDRQNTAFQGFSEGDLSAKVMRLVGSERIYPVGLRFSGGYEADESLDVRYAVGKAQFATALPIVDDILLGWHKLFNVDVPFAPPIAAIGFVRSRAQDSTREDLNRWEAEIKWTAPVTTHLDLKIAYRLFDIRGDGKGCQRLFEAGFIYYVDESRTGGVTMAFEEGARAVIGEIGSVILAGFEIKTP